MLLFFGPPFIAEETAGGRVALHSGAFLVHAAQCDPRLRHLAAAVHRHHRDGGKALETSATPTSWHSMVQWIGLGENLQENPIFNSKNHGFLQIFP